MTATKRVVGDGTISLGYTGWRMAAIGFAIFFFAFGGPISSIPMLYGQVIREFGWNRTEATLIYSFASVGGAGVALFLLGRLIDRFGLRAVLVACLTVQAAGLASLLVVNSLATYYLAGFMVGLGQGTTLICVTMLVARWFTRNLGLASGIAMMGSSLGGVFYPLGINFLLPLIGWRLTFASLGVSMLLIAVPLAFMARYRPSEAELLPEAATQGVRRVSVDQLRTADLDMSFRDILRLPMFWMVAVAIVLTSAVDQGVFQHTVLFLTQEVHLSRTFAASAISMIFAVGFFAKLISGRFFDWLSVRGVSFWYVLVAGGILMGLLVQGALTATIFVVARGFVHGGLVSETPVMSKHCFGPRLLNRVLPIYAGCFSVGSAIGPVSLAMIFDRTGSYRDGFILFAIIALVAALLLSRVRPLYRNRLHAVSPR